YVLGFPFDGPDCGRVAAEALNEIGVDIACFFIMTPLAGTEDRERYIRQAEIIDWDFNNLDSQHVTLKHERLGEANWIRAYRDAFPGVYSLPGLLRTIFPVRGGYGLSADARRAVLRQFLYFFFSYRQGRHPMVGGVCSVRQRAVRRLAVTDNEARSHYLGG